MTDAQIQQLLTSSWQEANGDWEQHERNIAKHLRNAPRETLAHFAIFMQLRSNRVFTNDIANGAYLINGGTLGSDGFDEFLERLISLPECIFARITHSADAMADVPALEDPVPISVSFIPLREYSRQMGLGEDDGLVRNEVLFQEGDLPGAIYEDYELCERNARQLPRLWEKHGSRVYSSDN